MRRRRPSRAAARAALDELYASLPALECKGLCHDSCTTTDASELERERIRERGVELPPLTPYPLLRKMIAAGHTPRCPALSPLNTCSVYDVRPLICRAFGLVLDRATGRGLMCEHGCIPDSTIHPGELGRVLREIEELSFEVTGVSRVPATSLAGGVRP